LPQPARRPKHTHSGVPFDPVAAPSKPIVGVVRDKDTGKPIPGVVLRSYKLAGNLIEERIPFRAVSDQDGRYRITGMPPRSGNQLQIRPPDDQPYPLVMQEAGTSPALEPVTLDFELKRGVWVDVKVTDKVTGKPVRCQFDYFVFDDNPHLKEVPGLIHAPQNVLVAEDGTFRVAALPGPGLIGVRAFDDRYLPGVGAERIAGRKGSAPLNTRPVWCIPEQ